MFQRQVAARVFAEELRASKVVIKDETQDKSPSFLLTPTGALVNRVLVAGVAMESSNIAEEGQPPYYRLPIFDGSNTISAFAGQYNPEAAITISEIEPPAFVILTAKLKVSEPKEDGTQYTSLRPEWIRVCDETIRNIWIAEAVEATTRRIERMKAFLEAGSDGFVPATGLGDESEDLSMAVQRYGTTVWDMVRFRDGALRAMDVLRGKQSQPPKVEDVTENEDIHPLGDDMEDETISLSGGRKTRKLTPEEAGW